MLLLIPNRKVKKVANIVLLLTKVLNLYSHFAIEDLFERMAPTLVFFFMLVTIGIDSEFCIVESLVTGIVDMWPEQLRPKVRTLELAETVN